MKRTLFLLTLTTIIITSCDDATVYEYTAVFEKDGVNDTITGRMISFDKRYKNDQTCDLCYDGLNWYVKGNWSQDRTYGDRQYMDVDLWSKPIHYRSRTIDRCKIGFFEHRIYPTYKREMYKEILYN